MSISWYFKSKVNLPIPNQVQLLPNLFGEVNQAVTVALEREELGNQAQQGKKWKYVSFMPKDCAATGGCGLPTRQFANIRIAIWLV